jgi:predicted membrane chloride channel (bestrophin family)
MAAAPFSSSTRPPFTFDIVDDYPDIPLPINKNVLVPATRYSSDEWRKALFSIPKSFVLRRISFHLLANTAFAGLVYLAYVVWPDTLRALLRGLIPAPGPHLIVSFALALLLVFRTNTAYDRYWEGRRLWGFLYSRTRDLARLAHQSMKGRELEHFLQVRGGR